jgi:glycosyltransferase involved in cell wall biosynthesis
MMNEGFYLPALEGMAMGRIVVCPDCGGNRAYLRHAWNGLMPARQADAIVSATLQALELGSTAQTRMREAALSTAASYSLRTEREVFQSVLARLDQLWGACS